MNSISRRLLVLLLGALAVAALLAGASTYLKAREEVNELFDYQLIQVAHSLSHQKSFEQSPVSVSGYEQEDDVSVQVWDKDGSPISGTGKNVPLPRSGLAGLHTVTFNNSEWRIFQLVDQNRTIQISQPLETRRELSINFALRTIIPLFFVFPALALLIWFVVRQTLKPLTGVADEIARRSPASLEPLLVHNLPIEIRPVVLRLNNLLERLSHALDTQKRFVADAAHELRTPLTAIQLQAHLLERSNSDEERSEALDRLKSGISRASRLVGQLLSLARVEPDAPPVALTEIALQAVIREVVAEQAGIAAGRGIDLGMTNDEPVLVAGEPDAIRAMISNLVDNAVRYTPKGGMIDVAVRRNGQSAEIVVTDSGPGIPPEERKSVFDRFHRGQTKDCSGSGLGLAIVKSAVERHGGTINLSEGTDGKGLRVTVGIPLHTPETTIFKEE